MLCVCLISGIWNYKNLITTKLSRASFAYVNLNLLMQGHTEAKVTNQGLLNEVIFLLNVWLWTIQQEWQRSINAY